MTLPWHLSVCAFFLACNSVSTLPPSQSRSSDLVDARGPFAQTPALDAAVPPPVWLAPERDVILIGQTPVVYVYAGTGFGVYRETREFELKPQGEGVIDRVCNRARHPGASRGFAVLNFECQSPKSEGLFNVVFEPSRSGLAGSVATTPLRVLQDAPPMPPAPNGWVATQIARGIPGNCHNLPGNNYEVRVASNEVTITQRTPPRRARIPLQLVPRMSPEHARTVQYVFEDGDGWIVMFDHGEFGGGIEWFPKKGGPPRSIAIGRNEAEFVAQNVNRAVAIGGRIFVLQGLSHLGLSVGQLGVLWREHDHFTSRVLVRFSSEPIDWVQLPDGDWIILTVEALWRATKDGRVALVARLSDALESLSSLARTDDGTLYVAGRNAVLRLRRLWKEQPQYASDILITADSPYQKCWDKWLSGKQDESEE